MSDVLPIPDIFIPLSDILHKEVVLVNKIIKYANKSVKTTKPHEKQQNYLSLSFSTLTALGSISDESPKGFGIAIQP